MSADRVFVDTNVLVYLFDAAAPKKQQRAADVLSGESRELYISTQVLQELYVALTRGSDPIASRDVAEQAVRQAAGYSVVQVDVPLVLASIASSRVHRISFWDALIVRAAAQAGCAVLLSEDLNSGKTIDGVTIANPFE